jgi:hypothetical protein
VSQHGKSQCLIIDLFWCTRRLVNLFVQPFIDGNFCLARLPKEVVAVLFRNVNVHLLHWNMLVTGEIRDTELCCEDKGRPVGKFSTTGYQLQYFAPTYAGW